MKLRQIIRSIKTSGIYRFITVASLHVTGCCDDAPFVVEGIEALTAELNVRFHTPVLVGDSVQVIGRLISQRRGIYLLEATLSVAKKHALRPPENSFSLKGGVIQRELPV